MFYSWRRCFTATGVVQLHKELPFAGVRKCVRMCVVRRREMEMVELLTHTRIRNVMQISGAWWPITVIILQWFKYLRVSIAHIHSIGHRLPIIYQTHTRLFFQMPYLVFWWDAKRWTNIEPRRMQSLNVWKRPDVCKCECKDLNIW